MISTAALGPNKCLHQPLHSSEALIQSEELFAMVLPFLLLLHPHIRQQTSKASDKVVREPLKGQSGPLFSISKGRVS